MGSEKFSNGFVWLGVLVGALSSIKAVNTFFQFGFKGIWADILDYYTGLTEPFRELILNIPFLIEAPTWLPDTLLVYIVLVMAGLRSTVLPYRFDEYYNAHNTRKTFNAEFPRKDNESLSDFTKSHREFADRKLVMARTEGDEFIVQFMETIPKWELVTIQSLKCLILLPVITLEPFRKRILSMGMIRQLSKKAKPDSLTIEYETINAKMFYTKWFLNVEKMRLDGFLQIIFLPIFVLLFLLGATYIN